MEAFILLIKNVDISKYEVTITAILFPNQVFFAGWGTDEIQMETNQEKKKGDQPVQC